MPIPENMSKREERYYWGTVNRVVKNGGSREQGEVAAHSSIQHKRLKKLRGK